MSGNAARTSEEIPPYLSPYIVRQDASFYTPIDHASWRFIMKLSSDFFSKHAHPKYLDGLRETGISTDRIPLISEMDERLRRFGWRAVAVSGFIPPAVFMEFLALGVLPIACDMRKIENLSYTPAPDIVHEAAGHAPIIADPDYAEYLHQYGEISRKAIFSAKDLEVYNAIRVLSDTKEDPRSTPEELEEAQRKLDAAVAANTDVTEATELSRVAWWTIEYGLVGEQSNPRIYGAGLLSSVSESFHCLGVEVRKIPLTLDCIRQSYDITRPQPQLFLASDFRALGEVLSQFRETMAYRKGGMEGLRKAIHSEYVTTSQYDSGIQVSGILREVIADSAGNPAYLSFRGPTQLSFQDHELPGQGADYHREGFGSPVGKLRELGLSPAEVPLEKLREILSNKGELVFESGVRISGRLENSLDRDGKHLVLVLKDCQVLLGDRVLFEPAWGTFDMACGSKITSVFGYAADRSRYLEATGGFHQVPGAQKTNARSETRELERLYSRVRAIRDSSKASSSASPNSSSPQLSKELGTILDELDRSYPEDWLLRYELLELDAEKKLHAPWTKSARDRLAEISRHSKDTAELITRGLAIL